MIVGHVGIALGAKGVRPKVPTWLLLLAALLPDIVDLAIGFAGQPSGVSAMWSHSIPAVCVLAAAFAVGGWIAYRDGRTAALLGALVLSHVLADYITGRKPSWPGGPSIGLRLYSRPALDFALEAAVIVAGWLLYRRALGARARRAPVAFALCAFLVTVQLACDMQDLLLPTAHRLVSPLWRGMLPARHGEVKTALTGRRSPERTGGGREPVATRPRRPR